MLQVNRRALLVVALLFSFVFCLHSSMWADDCTGQSKSLKDANVAVTVASPTQAPVSTAVVVTIMGKGLSGMGLVACPKQTGASEILGVPDPQHSSDDQTTLLHSLMSLPDVSGIYDLYFLPKDKSARIDLATQFVVTSSDDTNYIDCGFAIRGGSKNSNIGCSFVPLSYKATQGIFGKGIADRYIVVQVTVRNKNSDLEYLLQDVRLGPPDAMVASLDKKLARRTAERAEQLSAKAISFRLVEAGATVLTGIAGVAGNELLKDAANIVAGPAQTGFRGAIPDLSTAEINSVTDNGFSVTSTVIPKNSAIAVVAFLSSDTQVFKTADAKYKDLKADDLLTFQKSMRVQVAGIHIQQVDLSKPGLRSIFSQDPSIKAGGTLPSGGAPVVLQGTALNGVDSVSFKLEQASSQTLVPPFTVKLTPHGGKGPLDPSIDDVLIPKTTPLQAGDYDLSLITTDGVTISTNVKMTVPPASP